MCIYVCVLSCFSHVQFVVTLWDYSLSGSSVHGILQARILEWVAMPSSRGSSCPGIKPKSLMSPALEGEFLITRAIWEACVHVSVCVCVLEQCLLTSLGYLLCARYSKFLNSQYWQFFNQMGKAAQVEKCSKWQNMDKNLGLPKSEVHILFSELNLSAGVLTAHLENLKKDQFKHISNKRSSVRLCCFCCC